MALTYPVDLTAGTNEDVNDLNSILTAINTWANGNISSDDLAGSIAAAKLAGSIPDSKLLSPNNDAYKTILVAQSVFGQDAAAATYALGPAPRNGTDTKPPASGVAIAVTGDSTSGLNIPMIYFDDADFTVGSKTTKLRLRAQVNCNGTSWSAVTATFGLYPVTFAGAADNLTVTLGTVVAGSTVAIANPTNAGNPNQGNSGDITIPSDGQYCIGVVLSGALTNNAAALLTAQLQTRNV